MIKIHSSCKWKVFQQMCLILVDSFATNGFQSDASAGNVRKSKFDVTFNFSVWSVCCRRFSLTTHTTVIFFRPLFAYKTFSVLFLFIFCEHSAERLERRCLIDADYNTVRARREQKLFAARSRVGCRDRHTIRWMRRRMDVVRRSKYSLVSCVLMP